MNKLLIAIASMALMYFIDLGLVGDHAKKIKDLDARILSLQADSATFHQAFIMANTAILKHKYCIGNLKSSTP